MLNFRTVLLKNPTERLQEAEMGRLRLQIVSHIVEQVVALRQPSRALHDSIHVLCDFILKLPSISPQTLTNKSSGLEGM